MASTMPPEPIAWTSLANSGVFGTEAVLDVSTHPGFSVITAPQPAWTPRLAQEGRGRVQAGLRRAVHPHLGSPAVARTEAQRGHASPRGSPGGEQLQIVPTGPGFVARTTSRIGIGVRALGGFFLRNGPAPADDSSACAGPLDEGRRSLVEVLHQRVPTYRFLACAIVRDSAASCPIAPTGNALTGARPDPGCIPREWPVAPSRRSHGVPVARTRHNRDRRCGKLAQRGRALEGLRRLRGVLRRVQAPPSSMAMRSMRCELGTNVSSPPVWETRAHREARARDASSPLDRAPSRTASAPSRRLWRAAACSSRRRIPAWEPRPVTSEPPPAIGCSLSVSSPRGKEDRGPLAAARIRPRKSLWAALIRRIEAPDVGLLTMGHVLWGVPLARGRPCTPSAWHRGRDLRACDRRTSTQQRYSALHSEPPRFALLRTSRITLRAGERGSPASLPAAGGGSAALDLRPFDQAVRPSPHGRLEQDVTGPQPEALSRPTEPSRFVHMVPNKPARWCSSPWMSLAMAPPPDGAWSPHHREEEPPTGPHAAGSLAQGHSRFAPRGAPDSGRRD